MTPLLARRMADIQPFHVMDLLRRARELESQGRDIIHLEIGEPDFPTPGPVIAAATRFLANGNVPYTPAMGLPQLRAAISRFYHERFGAHVAAERIVVTPGASGALMLALAATTDPGSEWLLPDPSYPCNRHLVRSFEGVARALPVDAASHVQPTAEQVAHAWTPATRGLMVATPSNPTGTLLDAAELSALRKAVHSRGGIMIVDEIYQGLTYGVESSTVLKTMDDVFVVNSFSKYFGMTGWRLGWLVVPTEYVRAVEKLAQHFFISASTPAQHAALAAFEPATIEPHGAFYIYADISELADDSEALAWRLLEDTGVATTPGLDFGDNAPRRHLRLAYTTRKERLLEAAERLRSALSK